VPSLVAVAFNWLATTYRVVGECARPAAATQVCLVRVMSYSDVCHLLPCVQGDWVPSVQGDWFVKYALPAFGRLYHSGAPPLVNQLT